MSQYRIIEDEYSIDGVHIEMKYYVQKKWLGLIWRNWMIWADSSETLLGMDIMGEGKRYYYKSDCIDFVERKNKEARMVKESRVWKL